MELEIFNTMRTSVTVGLWMLLEIIVVLTTLFVIAGFAFYLGGIVWFCIDLHRARESGAALPARALRVLSGGGNDQPDTPPAASRASATITDYPARRGGARAIETGRAI